MREMPRAPMDTMPQSRLVIELKLAIDAGHLSRIDQLIRENPNSAIASHVLRNIGKERAEVVWTRFPVVFESYVKDRRSTSARGTSD